jgi:hypothetical protein
MVIHKKDFREKRKPLICVNCGTPLICMNKYSTLRSDRKLYMWYVCPRRKKSGEKGCGHISLVEVSKIEKVE